MKLKLGTLTLQCRQSREVIQFVENINFFDGQVSTGKSSIARLVDYCLGGDLERTPAILQELVSVTLALSIGEYEVVLEREAHGSNQIQATWQGPNDMGSVLAPTQAAEAPIWGAHIYNLSDLLFHFLGLGPMRVRRSATNHESALVRLSFRDIMWYCYLKQEYLESDFYRLRHSDTMFKSRDVIRFLVGFYNERISDLEMQAESARKERLAKVGGAEQLRQVFHDMGYDSEREIDAQIAAAEQELVQLQAQRRELETTRQTGPHSVDQLRHQLRSLESKVAAEEQALRDLESRLKEERSLRAELLTSKMKVARAKRANVILADTPFEKCPGCGQDLPGSREEDQCRVCGQHEPERIEQVPLRSEMINRDITNRIAELDESILRHQDAIARTQRTSEALRTEKEALDTRYTVEMAQYDSAYVANTRTLERRSAELEERVRGLRRARQMPEAIKRMENAAIELQATEQRLRREIDAEREGLTQAAAYIRDLEETFLRILLNVRVPGVEVGDQVRINRTTWIPTIYHAGDEALRWDFFNAGSGGKKTLLNVCYGLAVHTVAARHGLPLPEFLIIDTPMKNIGEVVNRDLLTGFYRVLYDLAAGPLRNTQFVIIDMEFVPPSAELGLVVFERKFTRDNADHPPLISYYSGP